MLDFEECKIPLSDGYEAYARFWPVAKPNGAVLYLHGIQSHCGWYERSARHLQQHGYAVFQPDRRGSGRNTMDRGHADSHQQLIADGIHSARQLLERTGLEQCHILGVSWGGKLACAMAIQQPSITAGLGLVCPGIFPRLDVPTIEKFKIGLSMMGDRKRLFDIPLNNPELFTSDPNWLEFICRDDLSLHQASAAFFLATRRMDSVIRELAGAGPWPVRLFLAGQDRIIDSEKTSDFFSNLGWPAVRITRYPQARHTLEFESVAPQYFQDLLDGFNTAGAVPDEQGRARRL